jgi:hypothetical protein
MPRDIQFTDINGQTATIKSESLRKILRLIEEPDKSKIRDAINGKLFSPVMIGKITLEQLMEGMSNETVSKHSELHSRRSTRVEKAVPRKRNNKNNN